MTYLTSDYLGGRKAGSQEAKTAGDYIAGKIRELNLQPFSPHTAL